MGLKEAELLKMQAGTRVRVKGEPAEWKKNGLFASVPSFRFAGARSLYARFTSSYPL